jgi:hypothetical protein
MSDSQAGAGGTPGGASIPVACGPRIREPRMLRIALGVGLRPLPMRISPTSNFSHSYAQHTTGVYNPRAPYDPTRPPPRCSCRVFLPWHLMHSVLRFSITSCPPCALGVMWSTWASLLSAHTRPQSWHAHASRISTACLIVNQAAEQYPRAAALGLAVSSRLGRDERRRSGLWAGIRWGMP